MSNQCEKCGREKEFTGTVLMSMPSINVMRCRACEPFEFSGSAVAGRTYRSGPHIGGGMSGEPEKVEWDGVGLPPVGCRVEAKSDGQWVEATVVYTDCPEVHGDAITWKEALVFDCKTTRPFWTDEFRPIRSEEDKKRDEIISALSDGLGHAHGLYDLMQIYHLMKAGKIPHIRIE